MKTFNVMNLPEAPEEWLKSSKVLPLWDIDYWHEAGKTRMENWGIAVLQADTHYVAYRYLKGTSYGYGG